MAGVRRINYSKETLDLLQLFANYAGHGNLSAALATVVKFGVPYLMSGQTQTMSAPPLVWTPAAQEPIVPPSFFVEQPPQQEETDPAIARLALLLDDWS